LTSKLKYIFFVIAQRAVTLSNCKQMCSRISLNIQFSTCVRKVWIAPSHILGEQRPVKRYLCQTKRRKMFWAGC